MSYWSNQIIWDLDNRKLVQLSGKGVFHFGPVSQYPKRHCCLVYTKASIEKGIYVADGGLVGAEYLLERGEIAPSKEA